MPVSDVILSIVEAAHRRSLQRTLDGMRHSSIIEPSPQLINFSVRCYHTGRSVLAKTVERELLSCPAALGVQPNAATRAYCAIRLSAPSYELFKLVHRLFFLNEGQDMKLLVLAGMERVKYPTYSCPHVDLYAWNQDKASIQAPFEIYENGEESIQLIDDSPSRPTKRIRTVETSIDADCTEGDESFSHQPPSPLAYPYPDESEQRCIPPNKTRH